MISASTAVRVLEQPLLAASAVGRSRCQYRGGEVDAAADSRSAVCGIPPGDGIDRSSGDHE